MPEITQAEMNQFQRYMSLGTPQEVEKKISSLEADNKKYRDERREAREAADGKVLVPEEEAALLTQYRGLGDFNEVKERLDTASEAQSQLRHLRAREAAQQFAKAAGLADETVDTLIAIPDLSEAEFTVRTKKVKNDKGQEQEVQVAYVKLPGEEKAVSFDDAKAKVPALKGLRTAEVEETGKPGMSFVPQGSNEDGGSKGSTIYDKIRQEAKAKREAQENKPAAPTLEERMGMVRSV